jgi:hypothetical protein
MEEAGRQVRAFVRGVVRTVNLFDYYPPKALGDIILKTACPGTNFRMQMVFKLE